MLKTNPFNPPTTPFKYRCRAHKKQDPDRCQTVHHSNILLVVDMCYGRNAELHAVCIMIDLSLSEAGCMFVSVCKESFHRYRHQSTH
mmetsp:Transcript_3540/g.6775  ORF Transcript_3540/g.6775 Transcript_3540/m.6775 type:complete len:87 (+) Transcript_3540:40-300(+)